MFSLLAHHWLHSVSRALHGAWNIVNAQQANYGELSDVTENHTCAHTQAAKEGGEEAQERAMPDVGTVLGNAKDVSPVRAQ